MVRKPTTVMGQTEKTEDGLDDLTEEQRRYVERLEAGEWTEPGPGARTGRVKVSQPLTKIVPLRMSDAQWRTLTREAEELGLRPTTLLRMWVLERLRDADRARLRATDLPVQDPLPTAAD